MAGNGSGRRHTREDVAVAALRILDDYGLPDLTMRRLAAALDVQPSALYWHFPNKQTLLADIADRIVARAAVDAGADAAVELTMVWSDRVRVRAAALRDALLAYRDGAEVVASTLALGLGSSAARDQLATAIAAGGFDDATARRAADALLHFVLGKVSYEQQRLQYDSIGARAALPVAEGNGDDPSADFAFGVDLLINGLAFSRSRIQSSSRP